MILKPSLSFSGSPIQSQDETRVFRVAGPRNCPCAPLHEATTGHYRHPRFMLISLRMLLL
jgi:hypothetical protein